jgi:hypothetical protein
MTMNFMIGVNKFNACPYKIIFSIMLPLNRFSSLVLAIGNTGHNPQ